MTEPVREIVESSAATALAGDFLQLFRTQLDLPFADVDRQRTLRRQHEQVRQAILPGSGMTGVDGGGNIPRRALAEARTPSMRRCRALLSPIPFLSAKVPSHGRPRRLSPNRR